MTVKYTYNKWPLLTKLRTCVCLFERLVDAFRPTISQLRSFKIRLTTFLEMHEISWSPDLKALKL